MDRLFSKYADPFSLLNGIILMHRLSEFVEEFIEAENENTLWEFYLHKVSEGTFAEFKESCIQKKKPSEEQLETTVKNSFDMLNNFTPIEGG